MPADPCGLPRSQPHVRSHRHAGALPTLPCTEATFAASARERASTKLKYTRKAFWENKVSPGAWWPVNETVVTDFDLSPQHSIAFAAMVEEDEGTDLTRTEAETNIHTRMNQVLNVHREAGFMITDPNFISTMRNTLRSEILKYLASGSGADDDLMEEDGWKAGRELALSSQAGLLDLVTFKGGNGQYQARYQIT